MVKRCGPPSQGLRTFLRNHAPNIGAMDQFVVPTIGFDLLYVLVIVLLARRNLQCHVSSDRRMDCPPDHGSFAEELEAVDQPKTSSRAAGQILKRRKTQHGVFLKVHAPFASAKVEAAAI